MNGYGLMSGLNEGMTNFLNAYVKMREIKNQDMERVQKIEQMKLDREIKQKQLENEGFDRQLKARTAGLLEERDPTTGEFKGYTYDPEAPANIIKQLGGARLVGEIKAAQEKGLLERERHAHEIEMDRANLDLKRAEARLKEEEAKTRVEQIRAQPKQIGIPKPKKFNDAQFKAAGFARRIENANRIVEQLESDPTFNPSSIGVRAQGFLPDMLGGLKSPTVQRFEQAQRDFINAVLRNESGAAIAESEFENARKQYFPQAGDSKEVIEQKRRARQQAFENFKAQSQGAFEAVPTASGGGLLSAPARSAPAFRPGDRRTKNGVTYERQADGKWKPVK